MAIKSSPFSSVRLTGLDAAQFLAHLAQDKPNPKAQASLTRGRAVLAHLKTKQSSRQS